MGIDLMYSLLYSNIFLILLIVIIGMIRVSILSKKIDTGETLDSLEVKGLVTHKYNNTKYSLHKNPKGGRYIDEAIVEVSLDNGEKEELNFGDYDSLKSLKVNNTYSLMRKKVKYKNNVYTYYEFIDKNISKQKTFLSLNGYNKVCNVLAVSLSVILVIQLLFLNNSIH